MLLLGVTIQHILIARDTVIFLQQNLGFVINFKMSVLTPTQNIVFRSIDRPSGIEFVTYSTETRKNQSTLHKDVQST